MFSIYQQLGGGVRVKKKDNSIPVTINIFEIFEDDVKKCTEHADKNRKQCVSFVFY